MNFSTIDTGNVGVRTYSCYC